jgi:hypothetical protein
MKKEYILYAIQVEEIMLEGDYASEYQPNVESRTTLQKLETYDTEEEAIDSINRFQYYSSEFTILPVYTNID